MIGPRPSDTLPTGRGMPLEGTTQDWPAPPTSGGSAGPAPAGEGHARARRPRRLRGPDEERQHLRAATGDLSGDAAAEGAGRSGPHWD